MNDKNDLVDETPDFGNASMEETQKKEDFGLKDITNEPAGTDVFKSPENVKKVVQLPDTDVIKKTPAKSVAFDCTPRTVRTHVQNPTPRTVRSFGRHLTPGTGRSARSYKSISKMGSAAIDAIASRVSFSKPTIPMTVIMAHQIYAADIVTQQITPFQNGSSTELFSIIKFLSFSFKIVSFPFSCCQIIIGKPGHDSPKYVSTR